MKIAFESPWTNWQGGTSWFAVFLRALKQTYGKDVTLYIFQSVSSSGSDYNLPEGTAQFINMGLARRSVPWVLSRLSRKLLSLDPVVAKVARRYQVDVLFGPILAYKNKGVPTITWLPDFQHEYLPELFTASEIADRRRAFAHSSRISGRIVVMSESVGGDVAKFLPEYASKVRVLPTVTYIDEQVYLQDPKHVLALYDLPERFVYLPNHFWRHKNHAVVFDAVKLLKDKGVTVAVVCSGHQGDYRHPEYFSELVASVRNASIQDQVKFLGVVPREHVFSLIREAVCVINPSLFEGLGLTGNEALSLGKKVMLSEIAAHREQAHEKVVFFNPLDSAELAGKLGEVWATTSAGPDLEFEDQARRQFPDKLRSCAESFMAVAREVVK